MYYVHGLILTDRSNSNFNQLHVYLLLFIYIQPAANMIVYLTPYMILPIHFAVSKLITWLQLDVSHCSYLSTLPQLDINPCSTNLLSHRLIQSLFLLTILSTRQYSLFYFAWPCPLLNQARWRLVSYNHFRPRVYACVYAPEAINY